MTLAPQQHWAGQVLWFWVGLLIFAVIGFIGFFLGSATATNGGLAQIATALLLILAAAIPGVLWIRRGQVALGSGLLVGYALASVASGGQCTFLANQADYGFLSGAFVYVIALGAVLVLALIVAIVDAVRRRRM